MSQPDVHSTLREWLAYRPGASRTFIKYGIDLCCDGEMSLDALCREKRLDPLVVMAELDRTSRPSHCELGSDWNVAPLNELCRHLEDVHHAYYRRELSRLTELAAKVAVAYAQSHPETRDLEKSLQRFRDRIESHIEREQCELFPAIQRLVDLQPPTEPPDVAAMIVALEEDHDAVDAELLQIRRLTHGFIAPADGCQTFQSLLDGLWELEMNLHQNVYEENRFLFPRAVRHQAALNAAAH